MNTSSRTRQLGSMLFDSPWLWVGICVGLASGLLIGQVVDSQQRSGALLPQTKTGTMQAHRGMGADAGYLDLAVSDSVLSPTELRAG